MEFGSQQCAAFADSLRGVKEMFQYIDESTEPSELMALQVAKLMGAHVPNLTRGFMRIWWTYQANLVRKVQEVRILQKEKQMLENKLEQLSSVVSTMVSGRATGGKDASTLLKDGHLPDHLHLNCEKELLNRELELAKLREVYGALNFDVEDCRKKIYKLETLLKNAEKQAATQEKERIALLQTHTDELTDVKNDLVRLKEENMRMRNEGGRLEDQLSKATLKNEQFVELLKNDSKREDELRRQQKILKGYLKLLALKFTSSQEAEDLQFELMGLECRGLDDDITSYLKTILEKGFKPGKCTIGTQTMLEDVSQDSSSTQTRYSTATEGTQTLSGIPSALHPVVPPLTEGVYDLHELWDLNFSPDTGEVEASQNLHDKDDEVPDSTVEPVDHAGSKRPPEVIVLSDTDDESGKCPDNSRHTYRQLSRGLERDPNAVNINFAPCEPSSAEMPSKRRKGAGRGG